MEFAKGMMMALIPVVLVAMMFVFQWRGLA
jgi:hypothetical protein